MCTNDEIHKMNPSSREADFSTKQEAGSITDDGKTTRASSSSATPWLKSKDPRIVRVSRAFGGKDRHSKVCTVRGLRDRRVRLSVPTAIQLYDLQDRLGLNQPSKVVDWLLNAAKHEIDELPPLQIPPGNFIQNQHSFVPPHQGSGASQSNRDGYKISNGIDWEDQTGLPRLNNFWNSSSLSRSKSKVFERETVSSEKENWIKRNEEEKQEGIDNVGGHNAQVLSSNFFPRNNNHSSLQGLLNSVMPYGSYYQLEPSNFTFSQLGSHGITSQQTDQDVQNFNVLPLQSTLSLPSGSTTHVLVCPQGTTQAYFPSHIPATSMEFDPRQFNHFHMLSSTSGSQNLLSTSTTPPSFSSTSQSMRPFQLSMTPNHIVSQNDDSSPSQPNKDTN